MTRCLGIDGPRTQKFRRFYNGTTGKPKPSDLEYYITSLFKAFLPSPFTVALPRSDKIGLSSLANSMYNLQFSESMATIISLPQVPQHDPTPSHSAASFPEVEVPIPTHAPESEENPTYEWIFAHLQSFNCDQVSKMCQIIAKADPDQVKLAVLLVQIFPYVTDQENFGQVCSVLTSVDHQEFLKMATTPAQRRPKTTLTLGPAIVCQPGVVVNVNLDLKVDVQHIGQDT